MPERLIRVGWYPSLQAADAELGRLREAGLKGYVGGDSERLDEPVHLLVPESQLEAARSLLGLEPEAPPPPEIEMDSVPEAWPGTRRCPDCRSTDVYKLPPYAGRVLTASVALAAATAIFARDYIWIGGAGLLVGWVAAMWLSRHSGHYRCRSCNREWAP